MWETEDHESTTLRHCLVSSIVAEFAERDLCLAADLKTGDRLVRDGPKEAKVRNLVWCVEAALHVGEHLDDLLGDERLSLKQRALALAAEVLHDALEDGTRLQDVVTSKVYIELPARDGDAADAATVDVAD